MPRNLWGFQRQSENSFYYDNIDVNVIEELVSAAYDLPLWGIFVIKINNITLR
jgi:hypothetical protein